MYRFIKFEALSVLKQMTSDILKQTTNFADYNSFGSAIVKVGVL